LAGSRFAQLEAVVFTLPHAKQSNDGCCSGGMPPLHLT